MNLTAIENPFVKFSQIGTRSRPAEGGINPDKSTAECGLMIAD
jgi:hypothetical protein